MYAEVVPLDKQWHMVRAASYSIETLFFSEPMPLAG